MTRGGTGWQAAEKKLGKMDTSIDRLTKEITNLRLNMQKPGTHTT
jgi:hypothetical protein